MTDRPILFSAPMVRALLDGRKSQTRRALKPIPWNKEGDAVDINIAPTARYTRGADGGFYYAFDHPRGGPLTAHRARFAIGDRLWVKETHACVGDADRWTIYRASGYEAECDRHGFDKPYPAESEIKWKPSIFMRRMLSRLTLTVTDVRVQRLQDCSEADALAEGVDRTQFPAVGEWGWPQRKYAELWDSINGAGAWKTNPWVVAVSFDVRKGNIDD